MPTPTQIVPYFALSRHPWPSPRAMPTGLADPTSLGGTGMCLRRRLAEFPRELHLMETAPPFP